MSSDAESLNLSPIPITLTVDIVYGQSDVDAFCEIVADCFKVDGGIIPPPIVHGQMRARNRMPALLVVITIFREHLSNMGDGIAGALLMQGFNRLRQQRLQRSPNQQAPLPPVRFDVHEGHVEGSPHSHADIHTQDEEILRAAIMALPRLPVRPRLEFDPYTRTWKELK